jgi:predicted component of type VI protein secretion system
MTKTFGPDFLAYLLKNEPQTYSKAMSYPKVSYWNEAVNSEIESIMNNHT